MKCPHCGKDIEMSAFNDYLDDLERTFEIIPISEKTIKVKIIRGSEGSANE